MAHRFPLFNFAVSDAVRSEMFAGALRAQRVRSFLNSATNAPPGGNSAAEARVLGPQGTESHSLPPVVTDPSGISGLT